jgi:hypothetical protein
MKATAKASGKKSDDHGKIELQSVVQATKNTQLYMIRVPKHVAISSLDGVKIKKFEEESVVLNFPMGQYVLDAACSVDPSGFRALVGNSEGNIQVSDAFAGCLSLRRVFRAPESTSSSPAV